jgi:hypothetical protein
LRVFLGLGRYHEYHRTTSRDFLEECRNLIQEGRAASTSITPQSPRNQQERVCGFPTSISPMFIAVGEVYAADFRNGTIAVAL